MLHQALGEAPVAIEQPELVVAEGSIVGDAAAIPVTAGPAPGPATGVMPTLPPVTGEGGFTMPPDLRPMSGAPNAASNTSPSNGDGPMQPVSGMPLWGSPNSVSAPPVSSPPVSAPPNRATGRVFASGSASVQHPVSSPPVSTPPASGPPASGPPASAPPVSPAAPYPQPQYQQPQYQQPQYPQPQYQQPQPPPMRPPVQQPVQQPQVQPYSQPRLQPVAPTRPMDRLREPPRPPQPGFAQPRTGGQRAGRAFVTFLVVLLLIAVPVVAGYVAYYLTAGKWPPPVDGWFPSAS
jgi:hypothetical protein